MLGDSLGALLAQLIRKSIIANGGIVNQDVARVLAHDTSHEIYQDDSELNAESETGTSTTAEMDSQKPPEARSKIPKTIDSDAMQTDKGIEAEIDHIAKIKCLPIDPEFNQKLLSRANEVVKRRLDCEIKNCQTSFKLKEKNDASDESKLKNEESLEDESMINLPITFHASMDATIMSPTTLNVTLHLEAPGTITGTKATRFLKFCNTLLFDFSHWSFNKIIGDPQKSLTEKPLTNINISLETDILYKSIESQVQKIVKEFVSQNKEYASLYNSKKGGEGETSNQSSSRERRKDQESMSSTVIPTESLTLNLSTNKSSIRSRLPVIDLRRETHTSLKRKRQDSEIALLNDRLTRGAVSGSLPSDNTDMLKNALDIMSRTSNGNMNARLIDELKMNIHGAPLDNYSGGRVQALATLQNGLGRDIGDSTLRSLGRRQNNSLHPVAEAMSTADLEQALMRRNSQVERNSAAAGAVSAVDGVGLSGIETLEEQIRLRRKSGGAYGSSSDIRRISNTPSSLTSASDAVSMLESEALRRRGNGNFNSLGGIGSISSLQNRSGPESTDYTSMASVADAVRLAEKLKRRSSGGQGQYSSMASAADAVRLAEELNRRSSGGQGQYNSMAAAADAVRLAEELNRRSSGGQGQYSSMAAAADAVRLSEELKRRSSGGQGQFNSMTSAADAVRLAEELNRRRNSNQGQYNSMAATADAVRLAKRRSSGGQGQYNSMAAAADAIRLAEELNRRSSGGQGQYNSMAAAAEGVRLAEELNRRRNSGRGQYSSMAASADAVRLAEGLNRRSSGGQGQYNSMASAADAVRLAEELNRRSSGGQGQYNSMAAAADAVRLAEELNRRSSGGQGQYSSMAAAADAVRLSEELNLQNSGGRGQYSSMAAPTDAVALSGANNMQRNINKAKYSSMIGGTNSNRRRSSGGASMISADLSAGDNDHLTPFSFRRRRSSYNISGSSEAGKLAELENWIRRSSGGGPASSMAAAAEAVRLSELDDGISDAMAASSNNVPVDTIGNLDYSILNSHSNLPQNALLASGAGERGRHQLLNQNREDLGLNVIQNENMLRNLVNSTVSDSSNPKRVMFDSNTLRDKK